jgi:hypothetical protein
VFNEPYLCSGKYMWRPEIDEEFEREINDYCSSTFRSEKSMSVAH